MYTGIEKSTKYIMEREVSWHILSRRWTRYNMRQNVDIIGIKI